MILRYGLVLLGVAIALATKIVLDPFISAEEPFLLFLAVVSLSAWYGGLVPGLLATAMAAVAAEYFFIAPYFSLEPQHFLNDPRLMLFVLEGAVVSLLTARVHEAIAQRRRTQQRYQRIVETAEEGIWLLDQRWNTRFVNVAMAAMLGLQPTDMLSRSIFEFIDDEDRTALAEALTTDSSKSSRRHEVKFRASYGAPLWTVLTSSPISDDEDDFTGWLAMVTDISAQKRAEHELAKHRDHLELMVAQRTRALEDSYERLRLSERMAMLGTLSAGLGHDVGNLLLPLRVRLDAIESRELPSEMKEDVQAIRSTAEYLQRLTNGLRLLTLNPDDAARSSQITDLRVWWLEVASFLKNALPRGTVLENRFASDAASVNVPQHLLTQAVFNLVHNAGQALQGKRGSVMVWSDPASAAVNGHRRMRLGVSDDGPGMSDEVKRRCLEPFFTTESTGKSSGLGLALVHLIVQKVGGTVEIDSAPGRGTTFVLTLPADASEQLSRPGRVTVVTEPKLAEA
jgi:PAS domain S-box-containing protein